MIRLAWIFAPIWAVCLLVVWFCDLFDPPEAPR